MMHSSGAACIRSTTSALSGMARVTGFAHPRPPAVAVGSDQSSTGSSTAIFEEVSMVSGTT